MSSGYGPKVLISIFLAYAVNIIQLFQALSFLKNVPRSGSWRSEIKDFIDDCKDLAIRVENDEFIAMYSISAGICGTTIILYMIFVDFIHAQNKKFSFLTPIQFILEYLVFGVGFIPMISKFIEVQICNENEKIDVHHSVKCYKHEQMVLLQVGFVFIGISFLINTVIIPALRFERNGVEKLRDNENYIEAIYYLVLVFASSLFGWLKRPEAGIVFCSAALLYALIFECYERVSVACSRCGVFASLIWVYSAAYRLRRHHDDGNNMIYALPVAYLAGVALRAVRQLFVKRKYGLTKVSN
jgi:hypothetical protein